MHECLGKTDKTAEGFFLPALKTTLTGKWSPQSSCLLKRHPAFKSCLLENGCLFLSSKLGPFPMLLIRNGPSIYSWCNWLLSLIKKMSAGYSEDEFGLLLWITQSYQNVLISFEIFPYHRHLFKRLKLSISLLVTSLCFLHRPCILP